MLPVDKSNLFGHKIPKKYTLPSPNKYTYTQSTLLYLDTNTLDVKQVTRAERCSSDSKYSKHSVQY